MVRQSQTSHFDFKGLKSTKKRNHMKQFLKLTAAPSAAMFALALATMATPASAGDYCRTDTSYMRSCGFDTLEQCQASSSGRTGTCDRDPFLPNTSNALAYAPKHLQSKPVGHVAKKPIDNQ
jgi:hypothetical protein